MQPIHCMFGKMSQKIIHDKTLGNNIRALRTERNMTQEKVVSYLQLQGLNTTRSSYSQIECGTYNIRVKELSALRELFDVSYDDFFMAL